VNAHWGGCGDPYNPVMAHGQHGGFGPDGLGPGDFGPGGFGPGGFGPGGFGRRGPRKHRHVRRGGRLPLFGLGVTGAGLAAVAVAAVVGIGQLTGGQTACRTSASAMSLPALSLSALSEQSGTVSGTATHYVLTGLPNCSYPSPPADDLFVALGPGLINVRYQDLADPPLPGPITMEVKSGSSQYWLALLADNTGNPLASVQVETASGGWISLARASYNYWIAQSGAGAGPFTVRLTDTEGNQVTVHNIALDPGAVQSTGVYMYGAGSSPAEPADASPPAAPSSGAPATSSRASSSVSPASPAASTVERAGAAPVPRLTAAALSPTPSATC
jgi:expansin (peptidoglycan-binding protein)